MKLPTAVALERKTAIGAFTAHGCSELRFVLLSLIEAGRGV